MIELGRYDERGSALLITLVLVAIITLTGIAVFDLSTIENRLAVVAKADAVAFEAAQSGLGRAMRELLVDYVFRDDAGQESWPPMPGEPPPVDITCVYGCVTTAPYEFRQWALPIETTTIPGTIGSSSPAQPVARYQIDVRFLDGVEAARFNQVCRLVTPGSINSLCRDVLFLRSTGIVAPTDAGGVPGYTARRTIQALVVANGTSPFMSAVTTGAGGIQGNLFVAGSVHAIGASPTLNFSGSGGMRNNWSNLDAASLIRLRRLPLVCLPETLCDPSNAADPNTVETLKATLRVSALSGGTPAVNVAGGIGATGSVQIYGADPGRKGQAAVDGVFVTDGCQQPGCTDQFSNPSNVHVVDGNLSRPYDFVPPPSFPSLTASSSLGGALVPTRPYACPPGVSCTAPPDFFTSAAGPAADNVALTCVDASCPPPFTPTTLGGLFSNLNGNIRSVDGTFTFRNLPLGYVGSTQFNAKVCWRRLEDTAVPPRYPAGTLMFAAIQAPGTPDCLNPAHRQQPVLMWFNAVDINVNRNGTQEYHYAGKAIILQNSGSSPIRRVRITAQALNSCASGPLCAATTFPHDHMVAFLTFGEIELGGSADTVDRVMGVFFTPNDLRIHRSTTVIGSVVAGRLCLAGACGLPGGTTPRIFQATRDPAGFPRELTLGVSSRWSVTYARRFWLECRRWNPDENLPPDISGPCAY